MGGKNKRKEGKKKLQKLLVGGVGGVRKSLFSLGEGEMIFG